MIEVLVYTAPQLENMSVGLVSEPVRNEPVV